MAALAVLTPEQLEDLVRRVVREELGGRSGLLTTDEAAEVAGVQPKTIRAWVKEGRLPVEKRRGRRMFFTEGSVIAARSAGPADSTTSIVASLRARSG